jgi:outer membrane receptor for ferrienterochelin and colicin
MNTKRTKRYFGCILIFVCLSALRGFLFPALAGTNGILEGTVKDKATGELLSGVNVLIVGTQQGASTDQDGLYVVQNVRAGKYDVRFTRIGYQTSLIKNVIINPDLRTRIHIQLEPSAVIMKEITVVQEKPLIQKDVTGTTFNVSGDEINLLPVDNVADVIKLKAGVTAEGNVRGGKTTEVLYLVDGLPVQDVIVGGRSADLPNSSIVGLSFYTGGFEPEYGNALSGVVNIVTKTGTNQHKFFLRADKDNLFGGTQFSKTSEAELSASGPILEDQLFYFGSFTGSMTDTRWWQDLQYFFKSPVERNLSGFGKLDYVFTPTMRLGVQGLYAHRDWRDYEFSWRFNLDGLPPEKRDAYRVAAIFSHSPSDRFFYTTSLSRYYVTSRIGGGSKQDVPVNDPYQYDFFLRYIVDGQRAIWSRSTQETYTLKADGSFKTETEHLIKFGGELNLYNLSSDIVKYEPRKTYFGKPLVNEPQLNFSSNYTFHPKSGSLYIQDKIDLPTDGILINAGLRYDFLNPTAERPLIDAIPVRDTAYSFNVSGAKKASLKQQVSPRFGAAMQIAENGYLFVNVGWYFQYPLFDYLYTGLDRVALSKGISALTGNPDLEPERTTAFEISLKYSFPENNLVWSATYFKKESRNLIDTKTFIPGDSKLAGNFGFAEYVNTPEAQASGFEIVVSRERGEWLTGEISWTYMNAEGTSGSAQDAFYLAQYGQLPAVRVFPLSWDQSHALKTVLTLTTPIDLNVNLVTEYHTGRPYTGYPTSTGFETVKAGLFVQNNERMPSYFNADVKIEKIFTFGWWENSRLKLYLDVRNVTNTQNVKWVDSNGRVGGELGDPGAFYIGRRTSLGLQVEF